MPSPERAVSPGVARLIPPELQEFIWVIHEEIPLLPSIFDLRKGKGRYTQHVDHLCLLPYHDKRHTIEIAQPLNDLRITLLQTETGILMRLSNKQLEAEYSHQPTGPEQGELF